MISYRVKFILSHILYSLNIPLDIIFCIYHGLKWKLGWRLFGWPIIQRKYGTRIEIGKRFTANSDPRKNSWGIIQPVMIKLRKRGAVIKIGDDVGLSGCTLTAIKRIEIGNETIVGTGSIIADNDAHSIIPEGRRYNQNKIESEPIIIKDKVFIGARSIILKGTTIGTGAVIGAGSVVRGNVNDYTIMAGNPAVVVGDSRKVQ